MDLIPHLIKYPVYPLQYFRFRLCQVGDNIKMRLHNAL